MSNSSSALPFVINNHQTCPFNFYRDGAMQQGICYGTDLYGLAHAFAQQDQFNAFRIASQLLGIGHQTIVTVSKQNYQVWVRLHTDEHSYWRSLTS